MTRLGIIRHGSTLWNKEGRAQGSSNIPLDEHGLSEAKKLADRLSNEEWDVIYSSPLLRAKQTAEAIAKSSNIGEVVLDDRLREVGGGLIEGTTEAERIEKWGEKWWELELGIEKSEIVIKRALAFIEDITMNHPDQNILIVSHGSFIRHLLQELIPHVPRKESPKNTSLTKLVKSEEQWDSELYNCTVHLDT